MASSRLSFWLILGRPQEQDPGLQLKQLEARAAQPPEDTIKTRMMKRLRIMRVSSGELRSRVMQCASEMNERADVLEGVIDVCLVNGHGCWLHILFKVYFLFFRFYVKCHYLETGHEPISRKPYILP